MADAIDDPVLTFTITDTKLYIPVVTLSAQDEAKILQQLKTDFKGTINFYKYQLRTNITDTKQLFNPTEGGLF